MRTPEIQSNASRSRGFLGVRTQLGVSLVETSLVLGIVGILAAAGLSLTGLNHMDLTAMQMELPATVDQAKVLARASGRNISVALGRPELGPDILPVKLSSRLKWGKPAHIPLPRGMEDPKVADKTGEAHAKVTITPRHTATAATWFLNDGTDALCMRLSGRGRLQMLRWRASHKAWVRV